jgi:hypothetical protein
MPKNREGSSIFNTSVALPRQAIQQIDSIKGDISRTLWMRRAILRSLEENAKTKN